MSVHDVVTQLHQSIDWREPWLWYSVGTIVFNPVFWNIAARREYHHRSLTKLACGNAYAGCYLLAITIFLLGIFRDLVFNQAIDHQPQVAFLGYGEVKLFAIGLWLAGTTLVLSSMYKLGITGTYLGDYFGILMDSIVTDFPFNVTSNPMYHGSTLNFVAVALYKQSVAGLALALLVYIMYAVALRFEEPFTAMIYAKRNQKTD